MFLSTLCYLFSRALVNRIRSSAVEPSPSGEMPGVTVSSTRAHPGRTMVGFLGPNARARVTLAISFYLERGGSYISETCVDYVYLEDER